MVIHTTTAMHKLSTPPPPLPSPCSLFFFSHTSTFQLLDKPWSQVSCLPPPPRFLPSIFIAHRVQQSHCSSIFHRVLLTHALALAASQCVHKKKCPRIYTSMHSRGFELTKLTYTRLEDNLIRHRGDRHRYLTLALIPYHHPTLTLFTLYPLLRILPRHMMQATHSSPVVFSAVAMISSAELEGWGGWAVEGSARSAAAAAAAAARWAAGACPPAPAAQPP